MFSALTGMGIGMGMEFPATAFAEVNARFQILEGAPAAATAYRDHP